MRRVSKFLSPLFVCALAVLAGPGTGTSQRASRFQRDHFKERPARDHC